MVFVPITSGEITTGEPVSNVTQTKIKDNLDSLQSRVTSVENGSTTVYPPLVLSFFGPYSGNIYTDVVRETINFNLTVTGIRLLIASAGVSGTTEIAVLFKRGAGAWTSILTTNPSAAYSSGDNYLSTNAVLNATNVNLQAGDIIRVDIISTQAKACTFNVRIDYNKT